MKRSLGKFLYEYLPSNTFNHAYSNLSGKIVAMQKEWDGNEPKEADLPEIYVINRIRWHINDWPNSDDIDINLRYTHLIEPTGAKYVTYPLTFECGTCGSVNTYDSENVRSWDDATAAKRTHCTHCQSKITQYDQLPFIGVCECGWMREIHVPKCHDSGMKLNRPTSEMSSWYWSCVDSQCSTETPMFKTPTFCPNRECDNKDMTITNHTASSAYHAQTENFVNITGDHLDDLTDESYFQAEVVGDYLYGDADQVEASDKEKARLATKVMTEEGADFDTAYEEATKRLVSNSESNRERAGDWLSETFESSARTKVSEELYEYLSIVTSPEATDKSYVPEQAIDSTTFQQLLDEADPETHLSRQVVANSNELRKQLNFNEVRLIKNFPVTTIAYGYSRIEPEPPRDEDDALPTLGATNIDSRGTIAERELNNETPDSTAAASATTDVENDTESAGESTSRSGSSASSGDRPVELNLFNTGGSYADTEFFVQTFDAEAVMIQLDIEKVLRWLETNDIISDAAAIDNPKQWFLTHVHPPSRYSELPQTAETDSPEAISRYCYTLLHSISHSFMHTIGALGSHQKESLVEHLLPRTMTFIIYKRPDTDVSLGGLWTLFEERFETVVANLEDRDDCTFDPVCRHDENGACEDCMFLSTITCQNVNHNLSRSLFFGGPFDGKDHVVGYKDITTADGA